MRVEREDAHLLVHVTYSKEACTLATSRHWGEGKGDDFLAQGRLFNLNNLARGIHFEIDDIASRESDHNLALIHCSKADLLSLRDVSQRAEWGLGEGAEWRGVAGKGGATEGGIGGLGVGG